MAEATTVDEVKDIHDKSEALRLYARQAKNTDLETQAIAILWRAKQRMGELSAGLEKAHKVGRGSDIQLPSTGKLKAEVLKEAGISTGAANRYEKIAKLPADKFARVVEKATNKAIAASLDKGDPFAKQWSGKKEWYTPAKYIDFARQAMGTIDLDPASCKEAQKIVKAKKYHTEKDDGLAQEWLGSVFMNPPYKMPEVAKFIDRLIEFHTSGAVPQAILLVNNATDTKWWHAAAKHASSVCFTLGRISFYDDMGEASAPTNGQCFFYFGRATKRFSDAFSTIGKVVPLV